MSLLAPLALLWLASIGVLVWYWRLAATQRQVRVSSLIPFEHLLPKVSRHRTQLVVNVLFWLQLAALLGLALALAQPVLSMMRARTILVILDTSASMDARVRGGRVFDRAQRTLTGRLNRKRPTDQVFLMTTAPASALTLQPTSDAAALSRLVNAQTVAHLGGNLSTAARLGRALLGRAPDETWIVTDEAAPEGGAGEGVRWLPVGGPAANVGIVGLDATGALCNTAQARLTVTVQNFSEQRVQVDVRTKQGGRRLAQQTLTLEPNGRSAVAIPLPAQTVGWLDVALATRGGNALSLDDRAWVDVRPAARLPIVLDVTRPQLASTVTRWLAACPALTWQATAASGDHVLVTDRLEAAASTSSAVMAFVPPAESRPAPSYWVMTSEHAIASYFSPVEVVSAAVNLSGDDVSAGTPVVSALVQGRQVPVVVADDRAGARRVWMRFDPSSQRDATPVLLAFFNSVRWLMGDLQPQTTREVLATAGWSEGSVRVRRPDGSSDTLLVDGGTARDERATLAGLYRLRQGRRETTTALNFIDPVESNLQHRASTWQPPQGDETRTPPRALPHPLAPWLMGLVLALLMAEWWMYAFREQARVLVHWLPRGLPLSRWTRTMPASRR